MIITRTPFRVSFFGGGTDYPDWYRQEGGAVLSSTVDKYCYITARWFPPFFPNRHRIVWSHIELVSTVAEILHPAVREGMGMLGFSDDRGVEIHHHGDLPARAGMGSSSSFAVGLIAALRALRGNPVATAAELAKLAITLEQDRLREHVGCQDQIAAAYGGFNRIEFATDGTFTVHPVSLPGARIEALEQRLSLVFTGASRLASSVAQSVIESLELRRESLRRMRRMVTEGQQILEGQGSLDDFGALLHEAWMQKRGLSEQISTSQIDRIYATARSHGAIGGKLLGAGGAGFLLLFTPPEAQASVREALGELVHVPISFRQAGASIIYQEK